MTDDSSTYVDSNGTTWAPGPVRPPTPTGDPVTMWPDSPLLPLWRSIRDTPKQVGVRCAADGKKCGRLLAAAWMTGEGSILHAFVQVAPRKMTLNLGGLDTEDLENLELRAARGNLAVKPWNPGAETAMSQGLPDKRGTLTFLDRDDHGTAATVACERHEGLIELDRGALIAEVERALADGTTRTYWA